MRNWPGSSRVSSSVPGTRALVALDHDGYGAAHVVLDAVDGRVRRVHHVFVYPRLEENGEPYTDESDPSLTDVPAALSDQIPSGGDVGVWPADPGGLVDGPGPRAALAALYGVPVERVEAAAVAAPRGHDGLQIVGAPFSAWLEALDLPWIGHSGAPTIDLR